MSEQNISLDPLVQRWYLMLRTIHATPTPLDLAFNIASSSRTPRTPYVSPPLLLPHMGPMQLIATASENRDILCVERELLLLRSQLRVHGHPTVRALVSKIDRFLVHLDGIKRDQWNSQLVVPSSSS